MQLRDSYLHCPRDGKKLAIFPIEEEGQKIVTHRCLHCTYSTRAPGQRPQQTQSPFLADLRKRAWAP